MNPNEKTKPPAAVLVSAVYPPHTLVETICDPTTRETAFLVSQPQGISRHATWEHGGKRFRPVRAANNLLQHDAIRLASDAVDFGDAPTLLADIDQYLTKYVSLEETARHLAVGYILLTWVYDAFSELPYLRFRGEYGTGKTRALLVVGSITYKPFFASGASTVSPIFHTLDTFRGTLVFDEADFRFSDEKAELVKILNNGNASGFPVLRTRVSERREFDPQAFVVFGPKIVGMRHTYEDRALESRFLSIEMQSGRGGGIPFNLPPEQERDALLLRNKLLGYRLQHRLTTALNPGLADPSLEARTNQILLPLLSAVPDEAIRASIRSFAKTRERAIRADRGFSREGQLLSVMADMNLDRLPLKSLVAAFTATHGSDDERPLSSRYVGTILRRLGFSIYKSDGVYVLAPGQQATLAVLAARYGVVVENVGRPVDTGSRGTSGT